VQSDTDISVQCGKQVEQHSDWFSEAVWCGDYSKEGFLKADVLFGTGGGIDQDGSLVIRPSASSPLDRVFTLELESCVLASNSLHCLLAATDLGTPESKEDFRHLQNSLIHGIDECQRHLKVGTETISSTICGSLRYARGKFIEEEWIEPRPKFSTYLTYISFLETTLRDIFTNSSDPKRERYCYTPTVGVSSGYDSPFISAVARNAGLKTCYTFPITYNDLDDDGRDIADRLGIHCSSFSRYAWQKDVAFAEAYVVAGAGTLAGIELLSANDHLAGKIHLTGWHGDMVWGLDTHADDYGRFKGVETGMSYTELRLHVGMLNVPVSYLGIGGLDDIVKISNSPEMKPWDYCHSDGNLDTHGGRYSRPICRRLLEESGVPRDSFAQQKKAIMTTSADLCHSSQSLNSMYKSAKARGLREPTRCRQILWALAEWLLHPMRTLGTTNFKGASRLKMLEAPLRNKLRKEQQSFHDWIPWANDFIYNIYRRETPSSRSPKPPSRP